MYDIIFSVIIFTSDMKATFDIAWPEKAKLKYQCVKCAKAETVLNRMWHRSKKVVISQLLGDSPSTITSWLCTKNPHNSYSQSHFRIWGHGTIQKRWDQSHRQNNRPVKVQCFSAWILNYPPLNSRHTEFNGLRRGKRDTASHCYFNHCRRCWAVSH